MCQSLGACLTLATARYISFETKVYIIAGLLAFSMGAYLILEISLWKQEKLKETEKETTTVTVSNDKNGPTSV